MISEYVGAKSPVIVRIVTYEKRDMRKNVGDDFRIGRCKVPRDCKNRHFLPGGMEFNWGYRSCGSGSFSLCGAGIKMEIDGAKRRMKYISGY